MKNGIFILAFCSLFASCNQSPEEDAFEKYKQQIPFIKLPYKQTCYDSARILTTKIPDNIFKKYAPAGASGIIGKMMDSDTYSAILYTVHGDIEYPVIQTYDIQGNKLNDLGLITGSCCGSNANCTGMSWGEIGKDKTITLKDSETTLIIPAGDTNKRKLGFHQINEKYRIDNTGHMQLIPPLSQNTAR